ncbi:unnamed protein product [Macrosiphum euphorbiae]|uniref:Uncharacterized protein n=1 Tax=Macrosiphum euphorbiae TaxID=13131 RepID=A0AAV0VHM9_9HEMI|nr:unnamed protein product [Macrosiphum euphorbiae]
MGRRCRQLQVPVTTVTRTACARLCGGECRVVVTGDGGPTGDGQFVYRGRTGVSSVSVCHVVVPLSPPSSSLTIAFKLIRGDRLARPYTRVPDTLPNIPVCGTVRSSHHGSAVRSALRRYQRFIAGTVAPDICLIKIARRVVGSPCT